MEINLQKELSFYLSSNLLEDCSTGLSCVRDHGGENSIRIGEQDEWMIIFLVHLIFEIIFLT